MEKPLKQIKIDDKSYWLFDNKKYLVGRLFSELEDEWIHLGVPILRRTIKKYIDGIK
jgi:hypothetical protein